MNAIWSAGLIKSEFDNLWNASDRETKREFVTLLDNDSSRRASKMKTLYSRVIYKSNKPLLHWPSQNDPAFYHATSSIENLLGILKEREVKVMSKKAFRGAFVSTMPELFYGNFILVFNRSIERRHPLEHVRLMGGPDPAYWVGYASPIPVTDKTIVKIMIKDHVADFEAIIAEIEKHAWEGLVIENYKDNTDPTFIVPQEWISNKED